MEHDYYGAVMRSVQFGPRHELTVLFDVHGKQNTATDQTGNSQIKVRFGGIINYDEVVEAFRGLNTEESLHYLRDAPASKPNRRLIEMEFDRTEQRIRIIASNVAEQLTTAIE